MPADWEQDGASYGEIWGDLGRYQCLLIGNKMVTLPRNFLETS